MALSLCNDNLRQQTKLWHLNSCKKVAACLYIPTRNDFIVSQNIGISKVIGSLCAERSAIATTVSFAGASPETTSLSCLCNSQPPRRFWPPPPQNIAKTLKTV